MKRKPLKKYEVTWVEYHSTVVEAHSKDEAKAVAFSVEDTYAGAELKHVVDVTDSDQYAYPLSPGGEWQES